MRIRVFLGNFLIRLGRFIQSLAIMVMRPDDLVAFNRQCYATPFQVTYFGSGERLAQGLNPLEESLIAKVPCRQGRLLLIGVGGGREAIPLARLGFEVTGVDFVPEMVQMARENAVAQGVNLEVLVQDISSLEVPPGFFQVAWCVLIYSCIPTRKRRVGMLQRVRRALAPGGFFICTFHWEKRDDFSPPVEVARKIFAFLTGGNLSYEPGDFLWYQQEFAHAFSSAAELNSEFTAGGFDVIELSLPDSGAEGGVLLRARP